MPSKGCPYILHPRTVGTTREFITVLLPFRFAPVNFGSPLSIGVVTNGFGIRSLILITFITYNSVL